MGSSRSNLLSWLQSTLSKTILSRVLGAVHLYQVWEHIYDHFFTQTKARARQLRTNLRAQSLDKRSMQEFLAQIKNIVDELAGLDCPVKPDEYVDAILEDLHKTMHLLFMLLKYYCIC